MFDTPPFATSQQALCDLQATRERLNTLTIDLSAAGEAELVELLSELERVKSVAAATQAAASAELSTRRASSGSTRGLAGEIALARRESPHKGSRLLGLATALVGEMPHTYAALRAGEISEWRATIMVRETAVLSSEDRAEVDRRMAGRLATWGDKKISDKARALGYRLDPGSALRRVRGAHSDRRVGIRPAPDTMTYLTGFLPVKDGVACWAALTAAADHLTGLGDERSRGQIMADILVARLTGRAADSGANVSLNLTMTDQALLADSHEAANLQGFGPIPAFLAREIIRGADRVWLTRLFTRPGSDELIAMEQRGRLFTGALRKFLILRDGTCSTPWCDAPIRHVDHIERHADGGATSVDNAQGVCVTCNLTKEAPGWKTERAPSRRHRATITTPTGTTYPTESRHLRPDFSFMEQRLERLIA